MIGRDVAPDPASMNWTDAHGRSWAIELGPDGVCLRSEDRILEIPRGRWSRDISVAAYGEGHIVRFDTFEFEVGFSVPSGEAAALANHIGGGIPDAPPGAEPVGEVIAIPAEKRATLTDSPETLHLAGSEEVRVLWPRVSPLAVWALICASVAFVPALGLLPAATAGVLLILHRVKTSRSPAYRHSRAVCAAAMVFLISGLVVSVPSGYCIWRNLDRPPPELHRTQRSAEQVERPADQPPEFPATFANVAPGDDHGADRNWGLIFAGLFVVMMSLTVHESAHAITAWWSGDDFARRVGRVTMNPLAHIDPVGTVLLPLMLYLTHAGAIFGWARPVPVRTERLRQPRRDHILVSIAGPGSNLLLASASMILLMGMGSGVSLLCQEAVVSGFPGVFKPPAASGFPGAAVFIAATTDLSLSVVINIVLAAFNMIPIPPLDGSWVLEHLFPRTFGRFYARIRPFGFLIIVVLLLTHSLEVLLAPVVLVIGAAISLVAAATLFV